SPLTELLDYAHQHAGAQASRQAGFISTYFDNTDPDELAARGAATLYAIANAHWRLLDAPREAHSARVRVFNPTLAEDGFVSEHSVIQIVNDNMPFLVDSVTMAINRGNRIAHWVVHPLMCVRRDAQGRVESVHSAASAGSGEAIESVILVECDRIVSDAERQSLADALQRVLSDVRSAVQDWQPMLERLHAVADAAARSALAAGERQEGVDFLRWLENRHFTFLGARDYDLKREGDAVSLVARPETGLGILRGPVQTTENRLPPEAVALLESDQLVLVTKAMTRATVHRPAWLDYIAIKRFDAQGQVVGEARFIGLYTAAAYLAPVVDIPQVRSRVQAVMRAAGVVPESHAAKSLQSILEVYPRDEMFQIDSATLTDHAIGILRLQERQRTRLFVRRDAFGRFTSALVFVPRERFNTELRIRIGNELMAALDGQSIEFTPMLTDSPQARIHYLVRARASAPHPSNLAALEARIARLTQRWQDDCVLEMLRAHGEGQGLQLAHRFANAFPTGYREDFAPAVAAEDADILAALGAAAPLAVKLYRPLDAEPGLLRLKIYNTSKVALSDSLPVLERMGARVLDEHPYAIGGSPDGAALWIHDLGLQMGADTDLAAVKARFEELFILAWRGEVESDALNQLVLHTALDARAITVLRAYTRYFKQLGFAFSQSYIESTLQRHPAIAQLLAELFCARFDPQFAAPRAAAQQQLVQTIESELRRVESLEEDRILRQFLATLQATLRTNAWQRDAQGGCKPYLSLKLDPRQIPGVPEPKPLYEIWVYSPRMEGVHLRMGRVARGGMRWSDRREDFRTEILGLVKAQQVKNTVIVPVGSKGGFFPKNAPAASARDAWMAEGIACYKYLICGMLDLTDNIVKGAVVAPPEVVRHDGDDPYLVVAADKGTATFSDIANDVAKSYGFWLGDAFASGGSVGYDHKA
ncbi:MAG: NAD-glutamate dehydrogenase domain-containing protein, partial [Rhodoferax sp.]